MHPVRQRGFTFVELIISMVIIGVALAGVLSVMNRTVLRSADPMLQEQAVAIAEAYMEEILVKGYVDPDGLADAGRATWDDVSDYHNLVEAPTDQNLVAVAGLGSYGVAVTVTPIVADAGEPMQDIAVTVTHPSGIAYTLHGYRGSAL